MKTNSLEATNYKQKYEKSREELEMLRQKYDKAVNEELTDTRNALHDAQRELAKWQGPVTSGIKAS